MQRHEIDDAGLDQEAGPRRGTGQNQRFKTLGAHLADLRKSLGVSQQDLAERSALTRFPFDRTFVAHVELGNAPPSTARFLSYLSLLQADPNTVLRLVDVAINKVSVPADLECRTYIERARLCNSEGRSDEALSWIFGGLRKAEEQKDRVWIGKLKIGAAIVLRTQGVHLVARRMAEEAVNCPELDDADRTRAAIMASQTSRFCNDIHSARAYLLFAESLDPKNDDFLTTQVIHTRALLSSALGLYEESVRYHQAGINGFERLGMHADEAMLRASLAVDYWIIGKHEKAQEEIKLALATTRRWPGRRQTLWVLINAGRIAMEVKSFSEARKLLLEAELRAKDISPNGLLLVVRAHLLDLALRTGDAPLRHFMKSFVIRNVKTADVDFTTRKYAEEVLARLGPKDRQASPSKKVKPTASKQDRSQSGSS